MAILPYTFFFRVTAQYPVHTT